MIPRRATTLAFDAILLIAGFACCYAFAYAAPLGARLGHDTPDDAISLGLTVEWNVSYTSNIPGFADPSWLTWPTESFLDGVVVNTTQAVPAARAG